MHFATGLQMSLDQSVDRVPPGSTEAASAAGHSSLRAR